MNQATQVNKKIKKIRCEHCGPIYVSHAQKWVDDLFYLLIVKRLPKVPPKIESKIGRMVDWVFLKLKILELSDEVDHQKIFFRTKVFIEEAVKRGIKIQALKSKWGFINHFYMEKNGKRYSFEGLPKAEHKSKNLHLIDDKIYVKRKLEKNDFPIAKGKSFWFWQKSKAVRWAKKNLDYPVITKPALSSMSQHIKMDIRDSQALKKGIRIALSHGPLFITEKYLENKGVYRATVIGFDKVACIKRIPAHVIGDGKKNIQELVDEKNLNPERGEACSEDCTVFKLIIDDITFKLLKQKGYDLDSIPKKDEIVYCQEKVILDIGADLEEVTSRMHPDNKKLFSDVARLFGVYLVGIDFLADDISISWKEQECAIIELNSMPFVDMHHHPSIGEMVNVGGWIAEMVEKEYFS